MPLGRTAETPQGHRSVPCHHGHRPVFKTLRKPERLSVGRRLRKRRATQAAPLRHGDSCLSPTASVHVSVLSQAGSHGFLRRQERRGQERGVFCSYRKVACFLSFFYSLKKKRRLHGDGRGTDSASEHAESLGYRTAHLTPT